MATLLNYDPEKSLAWNKKAMEKKDDIIAVVDKICADGFSNIFFCWRWRYFDSGLEL